MHPPTQPDPRFHHVRRLIDGLRPKLIDLTGRSRLISFRHAERSRREARVVGPSLDGIWSHLLAGELSRVESLPQAPLGPRVAPAEWAHRQGIPSDFGRHFPSERPQALRTLYFPDEHERRLSGIHSTSRLSLTERGATALFGMFGFLEWYESDEAQEPVISPLVTLPLVIERERQVGRYRYAVRWSGEDPLVNIALVERLGQDLDFPPLSGDTPEQWLERLEGQLPERERPWKVHRWLTVGILDFMRLPMWTDLGPERWPEGMLVNALLADVLGGLRDNPPAEYREEDVDSLPLRELVPFTVLDADASQFRALAEAMRERSIVIQGPPGTGKSQTITNLIALALHRGKRVLFVSEKQAALEVVRNRLEHVGLGPFCLTVHSSRADKKALIRELNARLDGRTALQGQDLVPVPGVEQDRSRLNSVPLALHRRVAATGATLHQAIGRLHQARTAVPDLPFSLGAVSLANVAQWDASRLDSACRALGDVETAWNQALGAGERLVDHPWHALASGGDSVPSQQRTVELVSEAFVAAQAFVAARGRFAEMNIGASVQADDDLVALDRLVRLIRPPSADVPDQWACAVGSWHQRQAMDALRDRMESHLGEESQLRALLDPAVPVLPTAQHVRAASEMAATLGVMGARLSTLSGVATERKRLGEQWAGHAGQAVDLWNSVGLSGAPVVGQLAAAERLASAAARLDPAAQHLRSESLSRADAADLVSNSRSRARDIAQQVIEVEQWLDLALDPGEASAHARVLEASKWWSMFTRAWWRGRSYYSRWSRSAPPLSTAARGERLRRTVEVLGARAHFAADADLKARLGAWFTGLDTDWEVLHSVAAWAQEVRALAETFGSPSVTAGLLWAEPARVDHVRDALARGSLESAVAGLGDVARYQDVATVGMQQRLMEEAPAILSLRQALTGQGFKADLALAMLPAVADRLLAFERERQDLLAEAAPLLACLPSPDLVGAVRAAHGALDFAASLTSANLPAPLTRWLFEDRPATRLARLAAVLADARSAWERFSEATAAARGGPSALALEFTAPATASALVARLERAAGQPHRLPGLVRLLAARQALAPIGVAAIVDAFERSGARVDSLVRVFERIYFEHLVSTAIESDAVLATFDGVGHESVRQRFAENDFASMGAAAVQLVRKLAQAPVEAGRRHGRVADYTGAALLRHVGGQDRPRVAVRDLFDRAGEAIVGICPCMLMSPLSVAQYLKPGTVEFDLVVMDEASQLRPEDAVGALLRARQAVIVGDPMQMPPSDFFRATAPAAADGAEDDDDADQLEDSILDVAARQLHPFANTAGSVPRLLWHYRSRHPSLIAYSNHEFYEGKLVLFPAADASRGAGIGLTLERVEGGIYGSSTNAAEALAAANAAVQEIRERPERSLGIVALNIQQRELIEAEVERLSTTDAALRDYIDDWKLTLSPFFVKNLENVQGDERDTIIISTVFGRDHSGKFHQNFGAVNTRSGPRRLNVLFSRAVYRMRVLTSMEPSWISAPSPGARVLREFLTYADTGILDTGRGVAHGRKTGFGPDSPFEEAILQELARMGVAADPQVGEGRYRIDIGVRHLSVDGRYALGIECDGATYHSSRAARDRDRLRQRVLEELGWKIHRIWSTDWFRSPKEELRRLREAIDARFAELQRAAEPRSSPPPASLPAAPPAAPRAGQTPAAAELTGAGTARQVRLPIAAGNTRAPSGNAGAGRAARPSVVASTASEVAAGLAIEAARRRLIELRERVCAATPDVPRERGLLRKHMMEALIKVRPTSPEEFRARIPLSLRQDTDGAQMKFLPEALAILEELL